uniref:C3H1-type domain-containing protein n=1 Tax=Oryza punctata TaxID=4537 RepID=A0A0E0LH07_ORYPU
MAADPNGHRRLPTGDPDQADASPYRPVSAVDGVTDGEGEATYSHFPPGVYGPTVVAYNIRDAANDDDERARHDQGGGAHDHHHDQPRQDQRGEAHLHDLPGENSKSPSSSADQQGNDTADMTPLAAPAESSYDANFPPLHEHPAAPVPNPAPASAPAPAVAGAMGSSSAPVQGDGAPDNHDPPRQDQRGGAQSDHPHDLDSEKTIGPQHGRITTSNGGSGKGKDKAISNDGDEPASNSSFSSSDDQQGSDTPTSDSESDTDETPSAAAESSYDVNFPPLLQPNPVPAPAPAPAVAGAMGVASHKTVLCMKWREGRCHNGGACRYAHSEEEQRIVPEMRGGGGGRPCPEIATKGWCKFGLNCKYCHGGV